VTFEDRKPAPDATHTTPSQTYWTNARLELQAWLQRNAASLAELYEGAVRLVYDNALPGRVRFVCHAVREIRNRLPDVLSGATQGGQLQYKNRLDDIVKAWQRAGFALDGSIPVVHALSDEAALLQPDIATPRVLFLQIAHLIADHVATRSKPEDSAFRLFEACAPENQQQRDALRPVIQQWLGVTDWFMRRAHDSGRTDADCIEDELRRKFELFESILGALVRGFFATVEELDEILEDTNS
jgi:hypothetical protein